VLKKDEWDDEYGQLPSPQTVLSKFKNFLNGLADYKDKVYQDRPCVSIQLSNKQFDILPCFEAVGGGGYQIPNYDLTGWTYSYPEQLYKDLEAVHKLRSYKVKQIIKAVKYWNRDFDKLIPSYHIEETAISIFTLNSFTNFKNGIEIWFSNAEYYLQESKFKSSKTYDKAIDNLKKANKKIQDAEVKYEDGKEGEAVLIWKEIFGRDFPTIDSEEAKNFSNAISDGSLKVASTGLLSTVTGYGIGASRGYHGGISND
jgi:hypothetical protein